MRLTKVFAGMAAAMGFTGVFAGAVGAHGVQPGLSDVDANSYETAVVYLFVHTLALMTVAILGSIRPLNWPIKLAGLGFVFGSLFFSGTILVRLVFELRAPGFFAPLGGSLLMFAWLALCVGVCTQKD